MSDIRYTVCFGSCSMDSTVGRFTNKRLAVKRAREYTRDHDQYTEVRTVRPLLPAWVEYTYTAPQVIARFWPASAR